MVGNLLRPESECVGAEGNGLRIFAPAKVNLFLHVVGRRADGYHLLESLVAFASFGDELYLEPGDRLKLEIDGPFARELDGAKNIVLRAATRLAQAVGLEEPGATIRLRKNLPVSAGLGGGSADAAAILRALPSFWKTQIPQEQIDDLALELGADVPACYRGRPVVVRGIGEEISDYDLLPKVPLLVVNPGEAMSTAEVFSVIRGRNGNFRPLLEPSWTKELDFWALLENSENDLEEAASQLEPAVQKVLNDIRATSACRLARMSGSGVSCFGLYDDQPAAQRAAEELESIHRNWWIRCGHLVGSPRAGNP